jgi:hypothetical protein
VSIWRKHLRTLYTLSLFLQIDGRLSEWRANREEASEADHVRRNPELYRERMVNMDAQRRKMQEVGIW